MKILAFAASSSRQSINKQLILHSTNNFKQNVDPTADIEIIDLNEFEMPIYSIDRETETGIPTHASRFYEKIREADALIISYAEHNGFYTAAYKNLFDWTSRIKMKVFQDKPMIIMAASPGPNGGANVLKVAKESAPHFGATIVAAVSIPKFPENFDSQKNLLTNLHLSAELDAALHKLKTHG